eukprot:365417-Chlamydomonas_euryale.AAC.17
MSGVGSGVGGMAAGVGAAAAAAGSMLSALVSTNMAHMVSRARVVFTYISTHPPVDKPTPSMHALARVRAGGRQGGTRQCVGQHVLGS